MLLHIVKKVFKPKLIKSSLRSTMGDSRLLASAILSMESDLVETLSFNDNISELESQSMFRFEI